MKLVLFDTKTRNRFFPLTLTRSVAALRFGIMTIKERWEAMSGLEVNILTDTYLLPLYSPLQAEDYIFVDATIIPTVELVNEIVGLKLDQSIGDLHGLVAGRTIFNTIPLIEDVTSLFKETRLISLQLQRLSNLFQLVELNKGMIDFDFKILTEGRMSNTLDGSNSTKNPSNIFLEEGTDISHSFLNASAGPIYIGKNVTIMEGSTIRGPFAICEGSVLKMATKVYGATTIGPYCMGGGEIKNSIIIGYSNKAHDGYLGDSIIGEWCNLGAGTSNSNLKNTGGTVSLYNYFSKSYEAVGNKCGVIIGDYSRTAINSSINTGSVIGVCCNVFGKGLLPKFIPDFTWGTSTDCRYNLTKAKRDIGNWKSMKNKTLTVLETQVLEHIFGLSENKEL